MLHRQPKPTKYMEAFKTIIWIVNIFSSLAIIGLVLMQHGKGADAGASFGGSGSAQGVFGSGGNANFLSRMTGISAAVFFASCLALGYIHTNNKSALDFSNVQQSSSVLPAQSDVEQPVIPVSEQVVGTSVTTEQASETSLASPMAATAAAVAGAVTAKAVTEKSDKRTASDKKDKSDKKSKKSDGKKSSDKKEKKK